MCIELTNICVVGNIWLIGYPTKIKSHPLPTYIIKYITALSTYLLNKTVFSKSVSENIVFNLSCDYSFRKIYCSMYKQHYVNRLLLKIKIVPRFR